MGKTFLTKIQSPESVKEKAGEFASLKIKTHEWHTQTQNTIKRLCIKNFFKGGDCVKILNFHVATFWKATWQYLPKFLNAVSTSHLYKLILEYTVFTVQHAIYINYHYRSIHNRKNLEATQVPISR